MHPSLTLPIQRLFDNKLPTFVRVLSNKSCSILNINICAFKTKRFFFENVIFDEQGKICGCCQGANSASNDMGTSFTASSYMYSQEMAEGTDKR